jgi:hypothetical protein
LLFPAARRSIFKYTYNDAAGGPSSVSLQSAGSVLITSGTAGVRRWMEIQGMLLCSGSGRLMFYGANEGNSGTNRVLDGGTVIIWNTGTVTV